MGIGAASANRRSTAQATVVGTPSTTATVVTSSDTKTNTTGGYPMQSYPPQQNYPPQQPGGYAYPPKQY